MRSVERDLVLAGSFDARLALFAAEWNIGCKDFTDGYFLEYRLSHVFRLTAYFSFVLPRYSSSTYNKLNCYKMKDFTKQWAAPTAPSKLAQAAIFVRK
jgi:hypothetical protein